MSAETPLPSTTPMIHQLKRKQLFENATYPHLANQYERIKTFHNWPKGTGVKPKDFVESGFSFLDYKDRVQCFCCGGILDDWRVGDDVDHEHARHLSYCAFIREKLGDEEVDKIARLDQANISVQNPSQPISLTEPTKSKPVLAYASAAIQPTAGPLFISRCTTNIGDESVPTGMRPAPENLHPVAPRDIRARLDMVDSRQILLMGYKKPLLAQVIGERLAETGDDFPSFMDFFRAVQHAERVLGGGAIDTLNEFYSKSMERIANPGPVKAPPTESVTVATTVITEKLDKLDVSENQLKRKKECNICMDNETDTVFMPCRHFSACEKCSDRLINCHICRRKIEQCIKVYV